MISKTHSTSTSEILAVSCTSDAATVRSRYTRRYTHASKVQVVSYPSGTAVVANTSGISSAYIGIRAVRYPFGTVAVVKRLRDRGGPFPRPQRDGLHPIRLRPHRIPPTSMKVDE